LTKSLTTFASGTILLLLLAVGIVSKISAQQTSLDKKETSASDAEVTVTIVVPETETLTGTVIVTLEDISIQDQPAVALSSVRVAASTLRHDSPVVVPINLQLVGTNADVNVAVHIDMDDNALLSDGDWISDSIVNVISNNKMAAVVDTGCYRSTHRHIFQQMK